MYVVKFKKLPGDARTLHFLGGLLWQKEDF